MDATNDLRTLKTISWGSIIGGVITVLAISMLLSTLGTSLGFSIVDPLSDDPANGAGTTVVVWSAISIIVSLAVGAFVAGRLAGNDGAIHGFLVWATALIVAAILGAMLVGSAVKATGNVLGSIASASGSVLSGAGNVIGKSASGLGDIGQQAFEQLNINTELQQGKLQDNVITALKKSNIPSLQPEFMQQQLNGAKDDVIAAVKQLATQTENSDAIVQTLLDKLKARGEAISQDVDTNALKKALTENTSLSEQEVNQTVNNLIATKNKTADVVNQRLSDAQEKINQAKQRYAELKQQAREQAAKAASMLAHAALWSFFALLIGAVVCSLAGLWGVKTNKCVRSARS
ncbi:CAP-Gly protein [Affinibrenneria salicis]|uniref:CAP-Gly protein n=1 Tax=Affinibrenneria salicis TaxID=2590031 RepID=A0A5J5G024_9GAMM|nr:TIGR04086 family membrane protein [Affinibrenneria salicis]KAA8998911.1 CAP-Gly protein [Affinibrenneria salicis]